jgi:hypothetical protein
MDGESIQVQRSLTDRRLIGRRAKSIGERVVFKRRLRRVCLYLYVYMQGRIA